MAVENLTTYTENDPNSKWTVDSTKAEGSNVSGGDGTSNLYKSFGADHFDALNLKFTAYLSSSAAASATNGPCFATPANPDTFKRASLGTTEPWVFIAHTALPNDRIRFWAGDGSAGTDEYVCSNNTPYYLLMERAAGNDTITVKIYSDSARTNLLDTLSVSGFGTTKWRYLYGWISHPDGDPAEDWYGYYENFDLQESTSAIKTINGLAKASVKTFNGLAIANVKKINGLA